MTPCCVISFLINYSQQFSDKMIYVFQRAILFSYGYFSMLFVAVCNRYNICFNAMYLQLLISQSRLKVNYLGPEKLL